MTSLNGKRHIVRTVAAVALTGIMAGCSLMHDDLDPCPTTPDLCTTVKLVYDYNTRRTDLFNDHVGSVTVYLFDKDGTYLMSKEHNRKSILDVAQNIEFDSTEVKGGHQYQFLAIAHGNHAGYDASLETPGFTKTELISGVSKLSEFVLTLDRTNGEVDFNHNVHLDTLWTSRAPVIKDIPKVTVPEEGSVQEPDKRVEVTIPLMRITNRLVISFWQTDFATAINAQDYDIKVITPHGNGRISMSGAVLPDEELVYSPHSVWISHKTVDGADAACVYAEFGMSRFRLGDQAKVVITNKITGTVTTIDDLSSLLAKGNQAFDVYGWSEQEYLDREYDYSIDFPLGDPMPRWIQVNVSILSWSRRFQREDL